MKFIHLNCDLGEGEKWDAQLMPLISAANIACGGHAGTVDGMRETVTLALNHRVEIGAHPSYPDKENFGRKSMSINSEDLKRSLMAQILSLKQIVESEGGKLSHIKPHGALYNDAAKDKNIAKILVDTIKEFKENIPLFVPENSAISRVAKGKINVILEAFADRNYMDNFALVSRKNKDAMITEKEVVLEHVFEMFSEGKITTISGKKLSCNATTFCVHGDNQNAVEILEFLGRKLRERNIEIYKN